MNGSCSELNVRPADAEQSTNYRQFYQAYDDESTPGWAKVVMRQLLLTVDPCMLTVVSCQNKSDVTIVNGAKKPFCSDNEESLFRNIEIEERIDEDMLWLAEIDIRRDKEATNFNILGIAATIFM